MGVKSKTIHSLSQALGTGVVFLELQLKEYTAAFLTFRDSIFGSDFYGTTCLHGLHVTTGSTSFGILWCSLNNNEGYKEVHQYQKFWGYYWHLVDSIWISLFMLFYLRIIFKAIYLLTSIRLFIGEHYLDNSYYSYPHHNTFNSSDTTVICNIKLFTMHFIHTTTPLILAIQP